MEPLPDALTMIQHQPPYPWRNNAVLNSRIMCESGYCNHAVYCELSFASARILNPQSEVQM